MKFNGILFFILQFSLIKPSGAQISKADPQQLTFEYLKDSAGNLLGTMFGFGGETPENLEYITFLINSKRFDLIKDLLNSSSPCVQFLSAQTLILANQIRKWKMDSVSVLMINQMRGSNKEVDVCYGCFSGYHYPISALLKSFGQPAVATETARWIRKCLNGKDPH
jgi:hypothetical protein